VAPAGGGNSMYEAGGDGGFYEGQDGDMEEARYGFGHRGGEGATQYSGGLAGYRADEMRGVPEDGTFIRGGDSPSSSGSNSYYGGGGGGGWYGGGAGGGAALFIGFLGSGTSGGGGSGWVGDVYDIEIEDGFNPGNSDNATGNHGYIILSWPDIDPSGALYS